MTGSGKISQFSPDSLKAIQDFVAPAAAGRHFTHFNTFYEYVETVMFKLSRIPLIVNPLLNTLVKSAFLHQALLH